MYKLYLIFVAIILAVSFATSSVKQKHEKKNVDPPSNTSSVIDDSIVTLGLSLYDSKYGGDIASRENGKWIIHNCERALEMMYEQLLYKDSLIIDMQQKLYRQANTGVYLSLKSRQK